MWLLIITSALLTTWLDLFFIPALAPGHAFYSAAMVLVLLLARKTPRAAFAFAMVSGVLADSASMGTPFGVFLVFNLALFAAARALMRQFFPAATTLSLALAAAATAGAGVVVGGLLAYGVNAWRLSGDYPLFGAFSPISFILTPLAAGALAVGLSFIMRGMGAVGRNWLLVRRRT